MHGLGTAAHGAMVVDELQSMRPRNKTEKASGDCVVPAKALEDQLRARSGTNSLMTG